MVPESRVCTYLPREYASCQQQYIYEAAVTQAKLPIPRPPAGLPAWTTFFQAATTEKPATMSAPKTALPIVFGAMTFGTPGIEGVNEILDVFQAHGPQRRRGLSATECALRWLRHHRSPEEGGLGDAIIVGASSAKQLEEILVRSGEGAAAGRGGARAGRGVAAGEGGRAEIFPLSCRLGRDFLIIN